MISNKRWQAAQAFTREQQGVGRPAAMGSDAEFFLLLSLALMALIARLLALGLSGVDEGMRGVLTHGLVILNGG